MIFTQVFVILYIIESYYPLPQPEVRTKLGYIAIITLEIILILEFVEIVAEFVFDVLKFYR